MAQSVNDSLLPVLARLAIASVFIWMGTLKLLALAGGLAAISRGDISPLGLLEPIRVVLELGGGVVLLLGSEAKRAAIALLAALAIEYFAAPAAAGRPATGLPAMPTRRWWRRSARSCWPARCCW